MERWGLQGGASFPGGLVDDIGLDRSKEFLLLRAASKTEIANLALEFQEQLGQIAVKLQKKFCL